jgi:serine/threonine-protein kinase
MLTGEPPFTGSTAQAIVARVVTEYPRSLTSQRHTIPPHAEAVVLKALEKLPADRFASAAEFAQALANPAFATATTAVPSLARRDWRHRAAVPAMAAALVVAVIGGWGWVRERPPAPAPVMRFVVSTPADAAVSDASGSPIALSHDGSRMVYVGRNANGRLQLFLKAFDQAEATALPGTDGGSHPFFSPDGDWVGFHESGMLRKIALAGGAVIPVVGTGGIRGASWRDDDRIVFASISANAIVSVSSGGGAVDTIVVDSLGNPAWPEALPDGRGVLFVRRGERGFELQHASRPGRVRSLGIVGTYPRYVEPGWLAYATMDGSVFAIPFDGRGASVAGDPQLVVQGMRVGSGGAAKLGMSRTGSVAFIVGSSIERSLMLVDRSGRRTALPVRAQRYESPRFSPDGRRIAVGIGDVLVGRSSIWQYAIAERTMSRLTFDSSSVYPEWSPDGQWILFGTSRSGNQDLWRVRSDASGVEESVLVAPGAQWEAAPTRSGLVFRVSADANNRDIYWRAPGAEPVPLVRTPFDERMPAPSPDGRWFAYVSNETGNSEVYLRPLPGPGGRLQISTSGSEPRWSRSGQLFYRGAADSMVIVDLALAGAEPRIVRRQAIHLGPGLIGGPGGSHAGWDVHPDGRTFLFVQSQALGEEVALTVLLNWFTARQAHR